MFEGEYNYTQAVGKCAEEGGIIAMAAAGQDTFTFLFNMFNVYWNHGGDTTVAFLDGSKGIMNPESSDWYCVNVPGACPSTLPWNPGQPNDSQEKCVGIAGWYKLGVGVLSCSDKVMAICKFTT